jgi:AAHS family 4-hydroxybenzoate transporter-like MFS transporter
LEPANQFPSTPTFLVGDELGNSKEFRPARLFEGRLAIITPLIWLAYIASSFAVVMVVNWTPIIFEALGYTRQQAALAATWKSVMGAIAALLLMRFTDRKGVIAIAAMPVLGMIFLVLAGTVQVGPTAFMILVAMIGFCLNGGHFGMHSICGIFYPSVYRANGAGWATSIAKIGSISGPLVGGWLLSTSLPTRSLYTVLAICPFLFAICILLVGRMQRRMLQEEAARPIQPVQQRASSMGSAS